MTRRRFGVAMTGVALAAEEAGVTRDGVLAFGNRVRAARKLPSLRMIEKLNRAAQGKAEDMARRGYFSHTTPEGKTPWDLFASVGYAYSQAGENLASGQRSTEAVGAAWMRSAAHRDNLLSRKYVDTGIGVARQEDGYVVVQLFGAPMEKE